MTSISSQRSPPKRHDSLTPSELADSHGTAAQESALAELVASLPKEKWLLASLLQKSIRRGQSQLAIGTAIALGQIDPAYVLRRLPVIAYEDIGVANPRLLVRVKEATRSLSPERSRRLCEGVGDLASRLALSTKSRTACDLLSLISVEDPRGPIARSNRKLRPADLASLAQSREAPLIDRAVAFRKLLKGDGPKIEGDRSARFARFCKAAAAIGAPEEILDAVHCGGATYDLHCFLPLAYEIVFSRGPPRTKKAAALNTHSAVSGPVLLCALDMFTRVGQAAYRALIASETELNALLRRNVNRPNRVQALGTLLFHAEGSKLDCPVVSDASRTLLAETERAEARACGFRSHDGAQEVNRWLVLHADRLASARREALARATTPPIVDGEAR